MPQQPIDEYAAALSIIDRLDDSHALLLQGNGSPPQSPPIDYAALVAADKTEASSKPTLEEVIRNNLHHFEGFARAHAKQKRAVKFVAETAERDPASIRRTFLKMYGRWDAFCQGVRSSTTPASTQAKTAEPTLGAGPITWE
jgi:hypothetical protein